VTTCVEAQSNVALTGLVVLLPSSLDRAHQQAEKVLNLENLGHESYMVYVLPMILQCNG
jgi:hypothetical protein